MPPGLLVVCEQGLAGILASGLELREVLSSAASAMVSIQAACGRSDRGIACFWAESLQLVQGGHPALNGSLATLDLEDGPPTLGRLSLAARVCACRGAGPNAGGRDAGRGTSAAALRSAAGGRHASLACHARLMAWDAGAGTIFLLQEHLAGTDTWRALSDAGIAEAAPAEVLTTDTRAGPLCGAQLVAGASASWQLLVHGIIPCLVHALQVRRGMSGAKGLWRPDCASTPAMPSALCGAGFCCGVPSIPSHTTRRALNDAAPSTQAAQDVSSRFVVATSLSACLARLKKLWQAVPLPSSTAPAAGPHHSPGPLPGPTAEALLAALWQCWEVRSGVGAWGLLPRMGVPGAAGQSEPLHHWTRQQGPPLPLHQT